MDYELGSRDLRPDEWEALERGEVLRLERSPNPIFDEILEAIARTGPGGDQETISTSRSGRRR